MLAVPRHDSVGLVPHKRPPVNDTHAESFFVPDAHTFAVPSTMQVVALKLAVGTCCHLRPWP